MLISTISVKGLWATIAGKCDPNLCRRNGTCVEKSDGELGCKCPPGASGRYCERGNFTTLKILSSTSYTHVQREREVKLSYVSRNLVLMWMDDWWHILFSNHKAQSDNVGPPFSLWKMKVFGFSAEINECNFQRCKNGAKCIDKWNDYSCICRPGWMGKDCDRWF